MKDKNKLIPKLRFPEFEKDGDWEIKELNELGDLINGLTYRPDDVREKGLLVLRSSNIQNGFIDLNDCVYVRKDIKGANLSEPNDILVCVRNGSKNLIGKNAIISKGIPFSTHGAFMTIFRAINPEFVFQLFQTYFYDKQVKADLGATINSINGKNFLKYEFPVPENPQEQQKIASCLSSLDELIAAHRDKLDALKEHKKGLMQNLFPQEGQKVPNFRFTEFKEDGEWNYLNGNELFEPISNKNHNSNLPILAVTQEQGAIPRDLIDYHVSVTDKSIESYKVVEVGDFIISLRSFQGGIEYSNYLGLCSPAYIVLRKKIDLINDFYRHYFKSFSFIQDLNKNLEGIRDGKMVSYKQFSEILIPNPKKPEQQKIASCLSALDELITAQTEKIEQLQQHKKGLMQGLFPKIAD